MPPEALYAAAGIASYLIGAFPFGYLIYKAKTGKDIREVGSGNIGATNVGRALGFRFFLLVFLLDGLKGFLPVLGAGFLFEAFPCPRCSASMLPVFCALMAFLGHMFPVYLNFKGGKGVATGLGVAFGLNWIAALVALGVFAFFFLIFRFVAIASMLGGIGLPVAHGFLGERPWEYDGTLPITVFFIVGAALILLRHLGNLKRILQGEEPRVLFRSK